MTTVLIAENDPVTSGYLQSLISGTPGLRFVGACVNVEEVMRIVTFAGPDLVLASDDLPGNSGTRWIVDLQSCHGSPAVLVFARRYESDSLIEYLMAGALGIIPRESGAVEIIKAIEEVIRRGISMPPKLLRRMVDNLREMKSINAEKLTEREIEILAGIAEGLSEKMLASRLKLSQHTVHSHLKNIYKKLQVKSKIAALIKARSMELMK